MTKSISVLLVDDEEAFIELQQTFLEEIIDADLDLIALGDPAEGLELIEDRDVDCVLCDYDMPDIDGLELLSTVRESYPNLPFILVTAKGNEQIASEAIRRGVTDYLQKPSGSKDYKTLANRIRSAVSQYRRQRNAANRAERLQAVLSGVADPVIAIDDAWQVTYCNDAAKRRFDVSEGSTIWNALSIEDTPFEDALRRSNQERIAIDADVPTNVVEEPVNARIYPVDNGIVVYARYPEPKGGDSAT